MGGACWVCLYRERGVASDLFSLVTQGGAWNLGGRFLRSAGGGRAPLTTWAWFHLSVGPVEGVDSWRFDEMRRGDEE